MRDRLRTPLRVFVVLCALCLVHAGWAGGAAAQVSNRAATSFSLRDIMAQFMTTAVADAATQAAQQRRIAETAERFSITYKVDPAQSLYHLLQRNPAIRNLNVYVDNTSGESRLQAMNFEIVRMDFDYSATSYSIFALLTRAGAQHVEPEAFVGIERIVLTQNNVSRTVTGVDMVGIVAALYKTLPTQK